jgi:anaerobic ribonucleoside-triphosphate reductase
MTKAERDTCYICGQNVERTLDGDMFCNKCGWFDEFDEYNQ